MYNYTTTQARVAPSGECLRGEGLVWLIGAVVCLLAACRGSNCTLTRAIGWPQFALQHHRLLSINCYFLRLKRAIAATVALYKNPTSQNAFNLLHEIEKMWRFRGDNRRSRGWTPKAIKSKHCRQTYRERSR